MIIIITVLVWFAMGTETYRRAGALRIEKAAYFASKNNHTDMCWIKMGWPERGCDCYVRRHNRPHLILTAIGSYTLWPLALIAYSAVNIGKAYRNLRGEDWSFFVKPKMIQSKSERLQSIETRTAELHQSLANLDKEIAKL